jgi:hypothetical protein
MLLSDIFYWTPNHLRNVCYTIKTYQYIHFFYSFFLNSMFVEKDQQSVMFQNYVLVLVER